ESVSREAAAVRRSVGVCDVSTLSKIDIQGPDAAAFLDRVYTNKFSKLKVGRARYGLMLREDGFAMDDGTTARLGEQHFIMTTTTANARKVMQHLEFCRQVLWPELDARLVSVSDHWAQYALAGPRSRDVLAKLVDAPFDISNEGFPRMGAGELTICGGVPARLFRVSFSGEMAYEIAVPARYGDATIRALMQAGAEFDITPYGTEALNVLRIEKGHVSGAEITGHVTARDLGLAGMVTADKDCIGKVLAQRPALLDTARPIVVGVKIVDPKQSLTAGSHFIPVGAEAVTANDEGYLTSVAFSPALGQDIGIGFLARGRERIGERIRAVDLLRGHDVECIVCSAGFYDPEGKRTHGCDQTESELPLCGTAQAWTAWRARRCCRRELERALRPRALRHLGRSGQGERSCRQDGFGHRARSAHGFGAYQQERICADRHGARPMARRRRQQRCPRAARHARSGAQRARHGGRSLRRQGGAAHLRSAGARYACEGLLARPASARVQAGKCGDDAGCADRLCHLAGRRDADLRPRRAD